ncbi:glutathionylspermidine synthase family protein [Cellvibrio japonicus]|uniref:Glutathionylspermidine synthase family protein n=1 Tax=Cellvibrio japonicus (strain Ueda107) TaxID=498211 RepID=B3PBJ7_CELJU|nr:glutathionylspermidine synthase family protein [Cellvibrio japonicus]ACE83012.1 glutathionylspermidine synthase family protein [Cellvibrio japonicus Ueda107]QEI13110.1 glutathionylspermidine synthase family protein [Cellvibrio japonicus]QEI16684.1 glutathionylspermidine synthase family protein [Cellvibrio japonicus]QEI20262.1 glutathionylspermidine synthase family protein [Cellvibrio japonicus]
MKRVAIEERAHWRAHAEEVGFLFHTFDGEPYWDETAYYQFSLRQVEEDLETPTEALHQMVMDMVGDITRSEEMLTLLDIPRDFWSYIWNSWNRGEPHLYGRMDFVYDGNGPAKLLELNYDTPTSLFETGFFQWVWLEEQIGSGKLPAQADQFNSLQDKLEQAFAELALPQPFYFASVRDSVEDKGTVAYLMDLATQVGMENRYIALEDIGELNGQLVDEQGTAMAGLFKLYPWEFMVREDFASVIQSSQTQFIEPAWKMLLSNKGILPLLWQRYPNHPNLLPAFFETPRSEPMGPGWVRKPLFSREGANVEMITAAGDRVTAQGPYSDGRYIRQALQPLPKFCDHQRGQDTYTMLGSWVVGDSAAGICIREDATLITKDSSRFIPHIILG